MRNFYLSFNLLFISLLLVASPAIAKQATYALVAPLLNYSQLEAEENTYLINLASSLYQAKRNGISQHSINLKNLDFNLSFNEASAPSSEYQQNIAKFYTLTNKEKDLWLKKQNVQALFWLELPSNLTSKEQLCSASECNLPLRFNFYFPRDVYYSFTSNLSFSPSVKELSKQELEDFSQLSQDFLAEIWNSCALAKDKKTYPLTLCAKNKSKVEQVTALALSLAKPDELADLNNQLIQLEIPAIEASTETNQVINTPIEEAAEDLVDE